MSLKDLRNKIDAIDEKVVKLLNNRAKISQEIGTTKVKTKKSIYSPEREQEVLRHLKQMNNGPMSDEAFMAVYREVMSSSLALENLSNVAHLGTNGSFTHMAALKRFGSQVKYTSCESIREVFEKVDYGECTYGVVPIENSIEGAVTHTFDILVDSELKICSQVMLKVSHNLISKVPLKDIKEIYSHSQVFGQCRHWLLQNFPKATQISVGSTTEAAMKAAKEKNCAAIASTLAAKDYNLAVLKSNIQDIAHNATRFLVVASQDVPSTGKDKTSILFSIKDKVGALHDMLIPFHENKINLTKIESRPCKKRAWDYYFFVDFEGHRNDVNVRKALDQLEGMCKYLKVVGSYPAL